VWLEGKQSPGIPPIWGKNDPDPGQAKKKEKKKEKRTNTEALDIVGERALLGEKAGYYSNRAASQKTCENKKKFSSN